MKTPIFQVDAFTGEIFGGNPAAVCALEEWPDEKTLQKIASENNLSETAFFVKEGEHFHIRWFTPEVEVDLCGHATLASGYVIFNELDFPGDRIFLHSKSGELTVSRKDDMLTLDFPAMPPRKIDIPEELVTGLGLLPEEVWKDSKYMAVYKNEAEILFIKPRFELLKELDCLGVIVTAPGENSDFVSRFFAPRVGINEDPVTGSAHTVLAPYWAERLNKKELHAYQLSRRKGELWCKVSGDRILISGRAVLYMKGLLEI